ncbi:hypothetical protein Tco_1384117 [Tanacetum coccineum]
MVAFLTKPKNSEGFHEIVDFLNRSTLRYALITNPTIYTSQIKQFWHTATVKTLDSGEVEINAIVDGHNKTITEASIRSSLQLADADGISNMPTTEIFEQLALMGDYKKARQLDFLSLQFLTQTQVADEATLTSMDVGAGGAATTDIGLDAGQGSGTIHKTPTRLNDEPLLGVNIPGSTEGSLSQTELTDLVLKLAKKVEGLETKLQNTKKIYGKVYIELVHRVKSLEDAVLDRLNLTERDESTIEYFHFVTPTKISASGEAHSSDISPEDQLGVLSAEKILADTGRSGTVPKTVSEVQTYTKRRRSVNTGSEAVNTTSDFLSAAKPSVNTAGDSI